MDPPVELRLEEIARHLNLDKGLVDDRVRGALQELSTEKVLKLLDDFEINLQQSKQGIRNPSAYLMGMAQVCLFLCPISLFISALYCYQCTHMSIVSHAILLWHLLDTYITAGQKV